MYRFWLVLSLPFLIIILGCQEPQYVAGQTIALPDGTKLSVRFGPSTDFPCNVEPITLVNTSGKVLNLDGWQFMGEDLSGRMFIPGDQITLRDVPGQSNQLTIYTGGDGRGFNVGAVTMIDPQGNYYGTGLTCSFPID